MVRTSSLQVRRHWYNRGLGGCHWPADGLRFRVWVRVKVRVRVRVRNTIRWPADGIEVRVVLGARVRVRVLSRPHHTDACSTTCGINVRVNLKYSYSFPSGPASRYKFHTDSSSSSSYN